MITNATTRFTAAGALLLTLAAMQGCKSAPEKEETPVVAVQAEKVATGDLTQTVAAEATLVPQAQAAIVPKISAPVKRFLVQRGSPVHAGEVLAVLDNADLAAAVTDAKGQLTQAQASYTTTTQATVPEGLRQAQQNVKQTKAALDVQQQQTQSRANLYAQGAIPRRDYETAQSALVQAQAAYDVAAQHLVLQEKIAQSGTVANAQGGVTSARGRYQAAEAQLDYASVRSPISGVVTDRPLYAGEMAQAGQPLLTVMDTSVLLAKVHLPQEQAAELQVGDAATVDVEGTEQTADGSVSLISPALDPGSSTVEVWVKIPNAQAHLKPGVPVHVSITANTLHNVVLVPVESINTTKTGGSSVMVIGSDSVAHEREVKLGATDGKDTQVLSGVQSGETVVTTGAHSLEDGTKVTVGAPDDEEKP